MIGLLAGGASVIFAASCAAVWLHPLVGVLLGVVGLVLTILGVSMVWYGYRGKQAVCAAMLDTIAWRGDEAVLDVGTGRGLLAIEAAKRATHGKVTGIDIWRPGDLSNNTRESALANVEIEGVADRVVMTHVSATELPQADATFDAVVSLFCLHNIEPRAMHDRACQEIARVLKPGGVAVIGDYSAIDDHARALTAAGLVVTRRWNLCGVARSLCFALVLHKPT
ncbi:MAG: class I SAM-dependent methyltransferase [Clostridia bacterium]|nr:class I SAM-dependent methyltransferase [Deltaproteobacteria bacterium]